MRYTSFDEFFEQATKHKPYPYQKRFAESEKISVINIPTGTGKTATAILGLWLWNRLQNKNVPKRLIYCLPMRVLAEQTKTKVDEWLKNLKLDGKIGVELLIGGSEDKIERILPNKEYIIIGTQDKLISGALNRAYGNMPSTWPIVFGLLNNDSMWVMDEVQIMENAFPTSIQLNHFREQFETYGPHKTVWMSATINPDWMETVDSPKNKFNIHELEEEDYDDRLKERNNAKKTLRKAPIEVKKNYNKKDLEALLKLHNEGSLTAIMVNTVKRAQEIYKILSEIIAEKSKDVECHLIHSRFRGAERADLNNLINNLNKNDNKIIVSTQVLEAGVDISVKTMITELAPWASMVQRFGRCNRDGKTDGTVYWVGLDKDVYAPYEEQEIKHAEKMVEEYQDKSISPNNLPKIEEIKFFDSVLRRQDVINLFDTAPDLSGNHIDVSRFVRNMRCDLGVDVFWRDKADLEKEKLPDRDELCNVPLGELKELLKVKNGHVWDHVEKRWSRIYPQNLYPGMTVMLNSEDSGYSREIGWDVAITEEVEQIETQKTVPEIHSDDSKSIQNQIVTLESHTRHVVDETQEFLKSNTGIGNDVKNAAYVAAKYHDVGKNHHIFQNAIRDGIIEEGMDGTAIYAKGPKLKHYEIPGFRHEVASALAYLKQEKSDDELEDLVAYLIMSHHGKIRLSLRNFTKVAQKNKKYILGINVEGDLLKEFSSSIVSIPETKFNMSLANVGRTDGNPSWAERTIGLVEEFGPFRLGYLEALFRRADWYASEKERNGGYND